MALTFDAYPTPASSSAAVNPAKLRDEIHRLSQRLVRAKESYNQDFIDGDPGVPLDEQLAVIESYAARLESATELLRQAEAAAQSPTEVPEQPSRIADPLPPQPGLHQAPVPEPQVQEPPVQEPRVPEAQIPEARIPEPRIPEPQVPEARIPEPRTPQPAAPPVPPLPRPTGVGIANPDGTPLVNDGGAILRTEDAAVGDYVRHAAEQRWLAATGRSSGGEFVAVCDAILAALAHKHGVGLEDERQLLARQVDARYRRDYG
ncbi:hypothetical protein ACPPVS_08280 [Cellulomonas sp. McL0617]|uniref:hypothetical protein n=1 Tax=Cellulomonas sp. McL0617 TaxID=3415675 RepID=UPI003CF72754